MTYRPIHKGRPVHLDDLREHRAGKYGHHPWLLLGLLGNPAACDWAKAELRDWWLGAPGVERPSTNNS